MRSAPITEHDQALLRDESRLTGTAARVLIPERAEEVAQCVRQTLEAGEKLTVRGSATGLNGGCVPRGGVVLDLSRLTRMGEIEGTTLRAEAGVTLEAVARKAGSAGLRFPPDPTEQTATLGGMFATGGAGPSALYFGPSSRYVTALDWVTPRGESWHIHRGAYQVTGGKLPLPDGTQLDLSGLSGLPIRGFAEGMDLIDCLSGTEGRFGVAAALELALLPQPNDLWGVVFFFENRDGAVDLGRALAEWDPTRGVRLTAAEFYDGGTLELLRTHREDPLLARLPAFPEGAGAALYVELEGEDPDASADALMELLDLFDRCGGDEAHTWAENGPAAVKKFRDMRHALPSILNEMGQLYPEGGSRYEGDFGGEPKRFPEFLDLYGEMLEKYRLHGAVYGRLLDNKLRLALLPENEEELTHCPALLEELAERVVRLGGGVACEYGVGRVKLDLVRRSLPAPAGEKLRSILLTVDPAQMMER